MVGEWLAIVLGGLVFIALPLGTLAMAIVAFRRSRRVALLEQKLERLERLVHPLTGASPSVEGGAEVLDAEVQQAITHRATAEAVPARPHWEPVQWEALIGKRALGWVSVVLLLFAASFFIRYAIDNDWIGPLGQVSLVELAGSALIVAGWRLALRQWRVFSQMLTAAGVIVVYLATYAAFGFYQLLPRELAAVFLVVILLESVLLALAYDSLAIALTAVLGGLMTPVLMHSAHDDYPALFSYLAALNLAVVVMSLMRPWVGIGSVALVGTQGLFWMWYAGNYHPEKLAWTVGFQAVIYLVYLGHDLVLPIWSRRSVRGEDLARFVLAAGFWFAAFYTVLRDDPERWQRAEPWMGTAAITMAMLYGFIARGMLAAPRRDSVKLFTTLVFTALAVSVGFIALAFPLQADAAWVALGWAAEGAALWWFGQRIANGPLRVIAAALFTAAVVRLLAHDVPLYGWVPRYRQELFVPLFNRFALPAIGVAICLLGGIASTRDAIQRRGLVERTFAGGVAAAGVLLLWLILSLDCYNYFAVWANQPEAPRELLRWRGQMALSILWAAYATVVLVIGFRASVSGLRWIALALYGATVLKVFFVDIRQLAEIYRVVAFIAVAVCLGLAAWGYQRLSPGGRKSPRSHE